MMAAASARTLTRELCGCSTDSPRPTA